MYCLTVNYETLVTNVELIWRRFPVSRWIRDRVIFLGPLFPTVILFGKVMEPLGEASMLEKAHHWGQALGFLCPLSISSLLSA